MMQLLELHVYISLVLLFTCMIATILTAKSVFNMGWKPFHVRTVIRFSWMFFIPILNILMSGVYFAQTYLDMDAIVIEWKRDRKK